VRGNIQQEDIMNMREGLTFDDVLLEPAASKVLPAEADTATYVTKNIQLGIPILSAAMDTVTESRLAIAVAQAGGIGVIHKNMDISVQADEVRKVKKAEAGMVINPLTISPDRPVIDAIRLKEEHGISGIPVVEDGNGKLVGILTNRDVRFVTDLTQPIREVMTCNNLVTILEGADRDHAKTLLHKHRIEKLLVVDSNYKCVGLVTVRDIERAEKFPNACKDTHGRLRVSAATGVGENGLSRAKALIDAGCDLVVVDTAHGHSNGVSKIVAEIKKYNNQAQILAGNVATADGAKSLIEAGADSIKVGIGPGSICTTRVVAGVGVPQLTALFDCVAVAKKHKIPVIADGGIKYSGDLAKAIAAGASCAMIGSLLAGTEESPGEVFLYQGRSYKLYRGMGSIGAMARGSADRYFQEEINNSLKLVPEGIEGRVPFKGPVAAIIHQLVGGLRAAMGYTGSATIDSMHYQCNFIKISGAGLRESHVHDVTIQREPPNYQQPN
tara:strand:+ start:3585 stop:5078 length:1494 start_codon:yes stop_codon:yes gene_type:complete